MNAECSACSGIPKPRTLLIWDCTRCSIAGIVSSTGHDLYMHKAMGEVEEIFQPRVLSKLPGSSAIGHTRYSTAGDKALLNVQPIMID